MEDVLDIHLAALSYAIEVCEHYKKDQPLDEHRAHIIETARLFGAFIALGGKVSLRPVVSLVPTSDEST